MKDIFDLKVNRNGKKDPLDINLIETGKSLIVGAIIVGVGIPLISGLFGGGD